MIVNKLFQKFFGIRKVLNKLTENNNLLKELIWADIFKNSIDGSNWLIDKSFTPGRWAVGYPLLFVLYKILDELKPKNILEFGLGQSTRMFKQYAEKFSSVKITTLEHDPEWALHFISKNNIPENLSIKIVNNVIVNYKGYDTLSINKVQEILKNEIFDLVLVDAPYGSERYSRSQILEIVPDKIKKDNFCIIIDDFNRVGEKDTTIELEKIMKNAKLQFESVIYKGEKEFILYCSTNHKFLTKL